MMGNDKALVYISEEHEIKMKDWEQDSHFYNFKDADHKDVFLLAAAKGYKNFDPSEKFIFKKISGGYFRESYLKRPDYTTLFSLYMERVGKIEDLLNKEEVLNFSEIAAYHGLRILFEELQNSPKENFEKRKIAEELDVTFKEIQADLNHKEQVNSENDSTEIAFKIL